MRFLYQLVGYKPYIILYIAFVHQIEMMKILFLALVTLYFHLYSFAPGLILLRILSLLCVHYNLILHFFSVNGSAAKVLVVDDNDEYDIKQESTNINIVRLIKLYRSL